MSLNHLLKSNGQLIINTGSVKTDQLKIKMVNGDYINFILPDYGSSEQVLLTDGEGKLRWADNNNNLSSVYCVKQDTQSDFESSLDLTTIFEPLRTGNFYVSNGSKVLLKTSLIYMWADDSLPLDFEIIVYINGVNIESSVEGMDSLRGIFNKFSNEMILDTNEGDIITLGLSKTTFDSNSLIIKKNSFYSLELL